jgi:hypothetical protein
MQPAPVIETDFIAEGELTIVHLPTGARYSTYAASNPDEFYVLRDGPAGVEGLCAQAKPILEQMLRRQRHLAVIENRSRRGLWR